MSAAEFSTLTTSDSHVPNANDRYMPRGSGETPLTRSLVIARLGASYKPALWAMRGGGSSSC